MTMVAKFYSSLIGPSWALQPYSSSICY